MKKTKTSVFSFNILHILFAALILRIVLSFFGTLQFDQGTFIAWSTNLATNGFKNFYNSWCDYLPGYLYVLWLLGKVNLLGIVPQVMLYKLPAIFADVLTGYLIYKVLAKNKGEKWGLIGSLIYVFNPAVFANSSLWGQADSLTALTSVAAIYFLEKNFILSAAALSAGTLIKPPAAFVLPVAVMMMVKSKWSFAKMVQYAFVGMTVLILGFAPFSEGDLIPFILNRLNLSAGQYPYTSVNSFNFWGLSGFWKPDNIYFQFGSYIFVLVFTIFLFIKNSKTKLNPYKLIAFVFAASFIFFTRMHERHLLPVFAPLAILAAENSIFAVPYIGYSIIYLLNLIYSYQWIVKDFAEVYPELLIKFIEVIGVGLVVYMFIVILKNTNINWKKVRGYISRFLHNFREKNSPSEISKFPKVKLSTTKSKYILYIILAFAFITRVFNLGSPSEMYFDEVYHAFTAVTMMEEDSAKAWEWWNTPPEGFAYEWTHPPLAKLGMVLGMSIFGQNSFGWRIPGALLGVGSVYLIYLIAKKIFKDETVGLISAGVFSLDGLPLVMNRIGMNDSYILFFSLLSIYMFMKEKDFLSAVFYGLALSSKWSALWAAPIIFILWLKRAKKFKSSILWFLFMPPIIYLLSYLPMFTTGHDLAIWWGMQKQMWWYHTGLVATHPYTSSWWTWPFLIRPIYLYTSSEIGGMVSRIYAMGNPFVFWVGIVSVALCAVFSYLEKNRNLGLVVFSYLIFFAPWAASPRIMFFYHYLPSIPFMSIAIGYVLRRFPKVIYFVAPICILSFIYFYPHWAGLRVPLWLDKSYYWVASWR